MAFRRSVMTTLLVHDADTRVKDSDGLTALDHVSMNPMMPEESSALYFLEVASR